MDFPFDVQMLFPDRVSVLDHSLVAGRRSAGRPDLQAHIATVVDELGKASAKAQQLSAPITSSSRLQAQRHQVYLLKDAEGGGGRGLVVGFLKVGYKKLFLLDRHGVHVEAEPLCVLDFYVAEDRQRHGYGLEMFDFMLQHKNLTPVQMAYDRPSPKFLSFLAKHFCLEDSVPQVNNFVVFEGFFVTRPAAPSRKVSPKKPDGEIKPYSLIEREAFCREQKALPWPFAPPRSPQRSAFSQYSQSVSVGSSPSRGPPRAPPTSSGGSSRDQSPPSSLVERCRARRTSAQGLAARGRLYSRHLDATPLETRLPGLRAGRTESHGAGHRLTRPPGASQKEVLHSHASSQQEVPHSHASSQQEVPHSHASSQQEVPHSHASSQQEVLHSHASSQQEVPHSHASSQQEVLHSHASSQQEVLHSSCSWTVAGRWTGARWLRQEHRSTRPW